MRRLADGFEKSARGVILRVAHNGDADTELLGDGAFGDSVRCVVSPFGVNVGPQIFQEGFDVGFGEEHDVVHAAERRNEAGPRALIENRPAGALQIAHAGIAIYADHENIAFAAGAVEIADVSDVQRIEAAVRQDDALAAALVLRELLAESVTRNDFGSSLAHDSAGGPRSFAANGVEELFTRDGGRAAFHYDEAPGDVGDVRGFE